jgi:hypothetical protein
MGPGEFGFGDLWMAFREIEPAVDEVPSVSLVVLVQDAKADVIVRAVEPLARHVALTPAKEQFA